MEASTTRERRPVQERFAQSPGGRIVITVFVLVTLLAILTANLPESRLRSVLLSADRPYLYGVGLDQGWSVFAPNPRREIIEFRAEVFFSDGTRARWQVPKREPVLGEYTDYRWLKWAEFVIQPKYEHLWQPIAAYAARQIARSNRRPISVTLVNRWRALEPPGRADRPPVWHERQFYATAVTDEMLEAGS